MSKLLEDKLKTDYEHSNIGMYKKGIDELVEKVKPNSFVTLTFSVATSLDYAKKTFATWVRHTERKLFGKWSNKKLSMLPFVHDSDDGGFHFHILIKEPLLTITSKIKDIFRSQWLKLKSTGFGSFKKPDWYKSGLTIDEAKNLGRYSGRFNTNKKTNCLVVENLNY